MPISLSLNLPCYGHSCIYSRHLSGFSRHEPFDRLFVPCIGDAEILCPD